MHFFCFALSLRNARCVVVQIRLRMRYNQLILQYARFLDAYYSESQYLMRLIFYSAFGFAQICVCRVANSLW